MITNDNDFLGALIKCSNQNNDCDIIDLMEKYKISDLDCIPFIKSLESENLVNMIDTCTVHVYPQGISAYVSPKKKAKKLVLNSSKSLFKFILTYVLGIVSGLIIAYLTHKFGW